MHIEIYIYIIYHHSTQLYISHTRSTVVSTDPRHGFDARSSTDPPDAETKTMACGSAWIMKQFVYCKKPMSTNQQDANHTGVTSSLRPLDVKPSEDLSPGGLQIGKHQAAVYE